jgi:histidinol-phosphate aminotransferase
MFPAARKAVMAMQAYVPPLEGRRSMTRLDFNENTEGFGQLVAGLDADSMTAYPEYQELIDALARHLDLPPEWLLVTNGSDEGLFVAAFTFIEPDQSTAVIAAPTFSLIPHYLQLCQARIVEVSVKDDLSANLEGLQEAFEAGAKLALLASPDNPTGAVIPLDTLEVWLARYPETVFVMDEAYFEYHQQTALGLLPRFPNLIVSRTFSKAWGMAGLRLGFLAAHPQMVEWMRRVRSPYSVNAVAAKTLTGLLAQAHRIDEQAAAVRERKRRVVEQVASLGYQVTSGQGNFFLVWAGLTAKALVAYFRDNGVLVRDRSNLAKMGGSVRVSVGTESEMETFLELLKQFGEGFGLIFDLDDTLVDTSQSFDACVAQLSGATRQELLNLRAEGGFNDDWQAATELLRRAGRPRPLEEVQAEGQALYLKTASSLETPFFQDAMLRMLTTRHPLFIFTGRSRAEYAPVWGEKLDPLFREVMCKDDIAHLPGKPSPDGLLALMSKHGLRSGAYIGNSVDDMAAARAANLFAIAVTTNQSEAVLRQAGAQHILSRLDQLPSLMMMKEPP